MPDLVGYEATRNWAGGFKVGTSYWAGAARTGKHGAQLVRAGSMGERCFETAMTANCSAYDHRI